MNFDLHFLHFRIHAECNFLHISEQIAKIGKANDTRFTVLWSIANLYASNQEAFPNQTNSPVPSF